jgi:hypothetical protein
MRFVTGRCVLLIALAVALSLSNCNNSDDDLDGVYLGSFVLSVSGTSTHFPLGVTLSQSGSSLSGMFEATNPNATKSRGSVSGSVSGSSVSLALTPTTPGDCSAQLSGIRGGYKTITGTTQINCPGQAPMSPTFQLSKAVGP